MLAHLQMNEPRYTLNLIDFFKKIEAVCKAEGVSELNIEHLRVHTLITGEELTPCDTRDQRITDFFTFKKRYPNIILVLVDKSDDFVFLTRDQYHEKIIKELDAPEFEKNNDFTLQRDFFVIDTC